jgi:hypothetical protein
MNILLFKKVITAVVGIVVIATLSHSAMVLPNNSKLYPAASPNYKSPPGAAKTNSPSVDPRYRIHGTNGPVWPPGLPFKPQTPGTSP